MSTEESLEGFDESEMAVELDGASASGRPRKRSKPSSDSKRNANTTTTTTAPARSYTGICRIEVARVEWNTVAPWQRLPQSKASGTGFCIQYAGRPWVLTNAHVVRAAVDIRVRLHGHTNRHSAKTAIYAPDVDLALIRIDQAEAFFGNRDGDKSNNLALEFAEDLPNLQESVHVVGFPTGGKTICITEGVVSRIDMVRISSFNHIMAIQIDAAINPGNSGGPAMDRSGKVTGVAFFKNTSKKTDNIGYLIPANVVLAFLGRCQGLGEGESPVYTLSPWVPYTWHSLENKSLRLAHQVPENVEGVLVTSVDENTIHGILQANDVLTHIDDQPIANDGQVVLRGDTHIPHWHLVRGKHVDATTIFTVWRAGAVHKHTATVLPYIPSICLRWPGVDYPADYLIIGALVMLPLSWALRSHKKCGPRLIAEAIDWAHKWPHEWEDKDGLVVLVDILAHELTFSYSRPWRRVTAYNGTTVRSLQHLRDLWQESCDRVKEQQEAATGDANNSNAAATAVIEPNFARIELHNDNDIVLEVREAMAAEAEILKRHQIPQPSHISPPNPRYKP